MADSGSLTKPGPAEEESVPAKGRSVIQRILRVTVEAGRRLSANRQTQMAAALSYRTLLSIFPALLLGVSILGLVLQDDARREELINKLLDRFPLTEDAGVDIDQLIRNLPTPASVAGIVSMVLLLWAASGMMSTIRVSLQAAWGDPHTRPYGRAKLLDLAFVLVVGALALVAIGLTTFVQVVQQRGGLFGVNLPAVASAAVYAITFLLSLIIFALFYHRIPIRKPPLRDVLTGAVLAAAGFELLKFGFAAYLRLFADYSEVYGSLAAVIAFLFFVYLAAIVFLYGGEFAYAWHRDRTSPSPDEPDGPGQPFGRRVKGLIRGLFVNEPPAPRP